MPYRWSHTAEDQPQELTLWPHQSLPPRGMVGFVLATFALITLPLLGLLGTVVLWGLLPFLLLAVAGIWYALNRSFHDRSITEVLTIDETDMHLTRHERRRPDQHWDCNTYWARATLHETGGPVPFYVTLSGNGREVEIGAFLSEDERKSLYGDLTAQLARQTR